MSKAPILETITPEKAKLWLAKNTDNRNLRQAVLDRYAEAIKSGQWEINGETIKFAEDGTLLDGQHRLHAIVTAGKNVQSYVVRDLPRSVFDTIDTGARREARDMLYINGEVNTSVLSAAARILYLHHETGEGYPAIFGKWSKLVTARDVMQTVERYPELKEAVSAVTGKGIRPYLSNAAAAYVHYIFSRINHEDAKSFFSKLVEGDGLSVNHPILHLRNRLVGINGASNDKQITKVALTIKAWNFTRKGQYPKRLEWSVNADAFPEAK